MHSCELYSSGGEKAIFVLFAFDETGIWSAIWKIRVDKGGKISLLECLGLGGSVGGFGGRLSHCTEENTVQKVCAAFVWQRSLSWPYQEKENLFFFLSEVLYTPLTNFSRNCECWKRVCWEYLNLLEPAPLYSHPGQQLSLLGVLWVHLPPIWWASHLLLTSLRSLLCHQPARTASPFWS